MTCWLCLVALMGVAAPETTETPIPIGSRRELVVDEHLIERIEGQGRLVLHKPTPREIVMVHDEPWEGNSCGYHTIFRDGDLLRMYYKCYQQTLKGEPAPHRLVAGYAESRDGVHWIKPKLGLFEFNGSRENNIVWDGTAAHDFTVFRDPNPDCPTDERYKSVAFDDAHGRGLYAFRSGDGIHWSRLGEKPLIADGAFDSQNLAFWDGERREYRVYFRDFREGRRDIKTATSQDFRTWSEPKWLQYPGAPATQLYTNQVLPYYRAPHIYLGFPARYIERGWCESMRRLPGLEHRQRRSEVSNREGMALTDGLFMSSRDGQVFRIWDEAFLRPGLRTADNWVYGDNYQNWGLVETDSSFPDAPKEISLYATEAYWMGSADKLRRYTLRVDGFVSIAAPTSGGQFVTRPLVFTGKELSLNFSTSAAGTIRVEIQDAAGEPFKGFALSDSDEIFGDALDRVVTWKGASSVAELAGQAVRLRVTLSDADLYSFQFRP